MSTLRQKFDRLCQIKDPTPEEEKQLGELGMQLISETHRIVSSIWHKLGSGDPRHLDKDRSDAEV